MKNNIVVKNSVAVNSVKPVIQDKAAPRVDKPTPKTDKPINVVGNIIYSVKQYYLSFEPAPDDVVVYSDSVLPVQGEKDTYEATVKIVIDWCGVKTNKVHIQFRVNQNGYLIPSTILHV